ncbi:MAG: LOG family protein [Chloroflexota bacterium]
MGLTNSTRGLISVFGSSKPQPGSAAYEQAREVGKRLADAGFAVATGGYSGTMAAVSQGAASGGGHVVGVGCKRIEQFRPGGLNEWVVEAVQYETLQERLLHLVMHNDGMIVLPGGIGTLSELALAWSFLQVKEIESRPLVLLGEIWRETMQTFIRSEYVPEPHATILHYANTPQDAVSVIQRELAG